ncbi:MAG: hypothetical protein ACAI43_00020 [Phycisphaerae bacterium]|nr:hypothetical protein [Tepidisphaeraceae bacterium]
MTFAATSKRVSIYCSFALLTMVGCQGDPAGPGSPGGPAPTAADAKPVTFPQTTETTVADAATPPKAGAAVVKVYEDRMYGKTEVRDDDYLRHADPVSPTGWTPWHHRARPHNWTGPMTYESSVGGSWTAKVVSVDQGNRTVTLQGPSGRSEMFEVGPKVQRLNEVKAGDDLTIAWTATLHGELRAPTPAETADPIKAYGLVDRASSDASPAAASGTALRVVTTVDAVDLTAMTVTLKGPLGNRIDVRAKSPENIRKIRVGDTIVATYSQGVAVSLTKNP